MDWNPNRLPQFSSPRYAHARSAQQSCWTPGLTQGIPQGGSNVILCARRVEALKSVAEACAAAHKESGVQQGGQFATIQLDVADKKQIASLLDKVPQNLRNIDILGESSLLPFVTRDCQID